jgi:hypothetical protein
MMIDHLTRYQRETIRVAVEIVNELPLCVCGQKHVHPENPHLAEYELLILVDAGCIMSEFGIRPTRVPGLPLEFEVIGISK